MDNEKLKNFFIVLFSIVNVFLLLIVIMDRTESKAAQSKLLANLTEVYAQNDVKINDLSRVPEKKMPVYRVTRNLEKEHAIAYSILGPNLDTQEENGNIQYYRNEVGYGQFHGTGYFEIHFYGDGLEISATPEDTAVDMFSLFGLKTDVSQLEKNQEQTTLSVTASGSFRHTPLFNNTITCLFEGNYLTAISGYRLFDLVEESSGDLPLNLQTVLLRFLSIVTANDSEKQTVENIQQGYMISHKILDTEWMIPVWKITANGKAYYLNGLSGKQESL